jgi:hypothetical protein
MWRFLTHPRHYIRRQFNFSKNKRN